MMGAELLADGGVDPASGSILRRIRVSAERMRGMIDELYDLARARLGGGIRLTQTAGVDLETITREVVTELDALRGNRSVQLVSQGDLRGTWDGLRLMQVLSNLTGNALKHGTSDEPVRITLDGEQQQFVRVSVENGGEVPVALRDNVFDPFCQGKASSGRREGLGLGLYIARQIVEAHGGSICVEAALGRTKFSVVLPRTEASIPQAAPA
jgi:signal transduction histidine kinase